MNLRGGWHIGAFLSDAFESFLGRECNGAFELKKWFDSNFTSPLISFRLIASANKGVIVTVGEVFKLNENYYKGLPKDGGIWQMKKLRQKIGRWPSREENRILWNYTAGNTTNFLIDFKVMSLAGDAKVKVLNKHRLKIY